MRHTDRIHRRLRVRSRGGRDLGWPRDRAFHRGDHINHQILAADSSREKILHYSSDGGKHIPVSSNPQKSHVLRKRRAHCGLESIRLTLGAFHPPTRRLAPYHFRNSSKPNDALRSLPLEPPRRLAEALLAGYGRQACPWSRPSAGHASQPSRVFQNHSRQPPCGSGEACGSNVLAPRDPEQFRLFPKNVSPVERATATSWPLDRPSRPAPWSIEAEEEFLRRFEDPRSR